MDYNKVKKIIGNLDFEIVNVNNKYEMQIKDSIGLNIETYLFHVKLKFIKKDININSTVKLLLQSNEKHKIMLGLNILSYV
jgi:hypothetical protein